MEVAEEKGGEGNKRDGGRGGQRKERWKREGERGDGEVKRRVKRKKCISPHLLMERRWRKEELEGRERRN